MWGQDRFNEPTEQKTGNELDPEGMSEDFCGSEFGPVCGLVGTSVFGVIGKGVLSHKRGTTRGQGSSEQGNALGNTFAYVKF